MHHHIPSYVVDCDHSHEPVDDNKDDPETELSDDSGTLDVSHDENTPLLAQADRNTPKSRSNTSSPPSNNHSNNTGPFNDRLSDRRPSLSTRLTRKVSVLIGAKKSQCDSGGPCMGYTAPCGNECFKALSRSPTQAIMRSSSIPFIRSSTGDHVGSSGPPGAGRRGRQSRRPSHNQGNESPGDDDLERGRSRTTHESNPDLHHHHVASNAFLSIGLQTSIAIALHKLPEGFITYATNHANPKLGFAVFMALFIHNITEGFAMALPLYLAIGSRTKAMAWSSVLGGASQPLGAGVAALWFKAASNHGMMPSEGAYGCMFAVTAGIMTSVALQLFSESLDLTHNKNLCVTFAFIGMGILGLSSALTAD